MLEPPRLWRISLKRESSDIDGNLFLKGEGVTTDDDEEEEDDGERAPSHGRQLSSKTTEGEFKEGEQEDFGGGWD